MQLKQSIRNDCYGIKITAEENGQVLGWAYLYIIFADRHDEPFGFLENVYVEPAHRSRGWGTRLVQAVVDEAKKRGCYKLIGTSRHSKADKLIPYYAKFGFENHGIEFRMNLIESKTKTKD